MNYIITTITVSLHNLKHNANKITNIKFTLKYYAHLIFRICLFLLNYWLVYCVNKVSQNWYWLIWNQYPEQIKNENAPMTYTYAAFTVLKVFVKYLNWSSLPTCVHYTDWNAVPFCVKSGISWVRITFYLSSTLVHWKVHTVEKHKIVSIIVSVC